ncbi:MAG: MATE family efflux transporter [Bacteroidaceae bacterium]|nr:MATE family efflux transporter [Bacteroidaceae bacterium]
MQILSYGTHSRALLKLGLPIVVGQLGIIVLSLADTLMVGRYGTDELAAASFVNNMFNLVIMFATGFSYGLTPIVGRLFGTRQFVAIGGQLKNGLFANLLMALLLSIGMGVLYFNLHLLGQPAELLPLMRPYYVTLLVSVVFVMLFNAFKQFADGITDTRTPMWILLGGNLLNIVGNWLLIYGNCGLPEMGLLGAGVATLLSRVLMVLCFAAYFFLAPRYRAYREGFMQSAINRKDFVAVNKLGMPVALQITMETASFSLTAVMVGWLGTLALATHQVMLTVGQLGFMLYYGMAAAVTVRVSNFHGSHDLPNLQRAATAGFRLIMGMAVCVAVVMFVFRNHFGLWFTGSAEVAAGVAALVIPFIAYQFGDGLQCTFSNALRGISEVKQMVYISFIAYVLISLPAAYVLAFVCKLGLTGIWWSFPLGLTTAGVLFWLNFRKKLRKMGASKPSK